MQVPRETMNILDSELATDIVDFLVNYHPSWSTHRERIEHYLDLHVRYNTCDYLLDTNGIYAFVRWNIDENFNAHVVDLCIRHDREGSPDIIRALVARAWSKHPSLKTITFSREDKYPYREPKTYSIARFLKRR